jgi:hypothetical protein
LGSILVVVLGICGNIVLVAYRQAPDRATAGLISGSINGMIVGAGSFITLIGALSPFLAGPMESNRTRGGLGGTEVGDESDGDAILPSRPTSRRRR